MVEKLNVVSAGVTIAQSHSLDTGLDAGERLRGYSRQLAGLYDIADMSGERVRVTFADVQSRDIPASSYPPFATQEHEDPTVAADAWRELGI